MKIRLTRDGHYWIGNERVESQDVTDVLPSITIPVGVSHFEIGDGKAIAWDADCNQVDPSGIPASEIEAEATTIIAVRDARIQAEIDAATPVLTEAEQALDDLQRTDSELILASARAIEDFLEERVAEGKFVAQPVKDKIAERKELRNKL